MSVVSYILGILVALITLGVVVEMLRRRRLRERHAVWWLLFGLLALIIGVFPSMLTWAAHLVGIAVPTNLAFFVSIVILALVSLQHSAELTELETESRALAERVALQGIQIAKLERQSTSREPQRPTEPADE